MAFSTRLLNKTLPAACTSRRSVSRRSVVVVRAEDTKLASAKKTTELELASASPRWVDQLSGRQWMLQQPGITRPFPGMFDPANFTGSAQFSVDEGKRFRESELAHCRVAMLAAVGWLVAERFHPLFGGQIEGPAFVHFQKVQMMLPSFWIKLTLAIGVCESYRIGRAYNGLGKSELMRADHIPGDLGFDPLGLFPKEASKQRAMQDRELNNGRLAMIAMAGFAAQEEVNHRIIFGGIMDVDPNPPSAFPPYN